MAKKYEIQNLKFPQPDLVSTRSSTLARSMASSLMPRIGIDDNVKGETMINQWANLLYDNNVPDPLTCVYCGKKAVELDHLFPLINNQQPSGYCTELANLVPCCRECNGSKSSKTWWEYMCNEKSNSQRANLTETGGVDGLEKRKERLRCFCYKNNLPYQDKNGSIINPKLPTHCLNYLEDSKIKEWWDGLFNDIIVKALDLVQIQINAFNAGIENYVQSRKTNQSHANEKNSFDDYYCYLIQELQESLNQANKALEKVNNDLNKKEEKVNAAIKKGNDTILKKKAALQKAERTAEEAQEKADGLEIIAMSVLSNKAKNAAEKAREKAQKAKEIIANKKEAFEKAKEATEKDIAKKQKTLEKAKQKSNEAKQKASNMRSEIKSKKSSLKDNKKEVMNAYMKGCDFAKQYVERHGEEQIISFEELYGGNNGKN